MPKRILPAILLAALIVGTADILAAFLSAYLKNNTRPGAVLKFIASGIFGRKAFAGGSDMVTAGLLFHYIIALLFSAFFFFIYPKFTWLTKHKIVFGVLYGLLVWLTMNRIVLPMSQTPSIPFRLPNAMLSAGILIVAIGLPLSFLAATYYSRQKTATYAK